MKKFQTKFIASAILICFSIALAKKDTIAIIDAGSSGSRLYVYEVNKTTAETKELHNEKKEPGLSDPAGFANIGLLLENPKVAYVKSREKPLYVLATAGMRMLTEDSAKEIYGKIKLDGYNLKSAMTISGRYEGFYAWIAAGVKNGHFNENLNGLKNENSNFGIVELGGASMQQAYSLGSGYINGFGVPVYSRSYLGWGIDQIDLSKPEIKSKTKKYNSDKPNLDDMKIIWYQLGGGFIKDSLSYSKKYKTWILKDKPNLQKMQHPKNASDWTEGAAIDIIINNRTPEGFDYKNPN